MWEPARIDANGNPQENLDRGEIKPGQILAYLRMEGRQLFAKVVDYSAYLAQRADPRLRSAHGIVPLAVSGITTAGSAVLVGRRGTRVTAYAGFFELVPSGGIETACVLPSGVVDFRLQLLKELKEEVGLSDVLTDTITPFALVLDRNDGVCDLCLEIEPNEPRDIVASSCVPNEEYESFAFIEKTELNEFCARHHGEIVPTSLAILRVRGLLR
jgi:hypothetical protein